MNHFDITKELTRVSDKQKADIQSRFFKTGKGEYGEGDIFIGVTVPMQRRVALYFIDVTLSDLEKLLHSKIHEHRFTALEILVAKYEKLLKQKDKKSVSVEIKKVVDFYLKNLDFVNNWDLVDTSANYILGDYLVNKNRKILYKLVISKNLWRKRVAIISTFAFIKRGDFKDTLSLVKILMEDKEDLIQKACGWMLREVGKKDKKVLVSFLDTFYKKMPRVMLRYAIERLEKKDRLFYMKNNI